jgi:hypothetical protein
MARQTEKLSDKFANGGNKHGEKEQLFFAESGRVDPEWAVIDLLRSQVDTITDVVNANDAGSGSFAAVTKNLTSASSSFSTRVTANDAKVSMVIGTRSTEAKAGNTTTISTPQAALITALAKGVTNATGHNIKLTLNDAGALVIAINRSTYTISADR